MIEKKVQYFLKKHECNLTNKSVAVGVSGGPDSLALLHLLWKYKQKFQMNIMAIHVDHMFRGEESYQDAMFVHEFCQERGIAFEMTRANVPQYMKKTGKGSQLAARELRYEFYAEVMKKHSIRYLALGHHADDQIETILMRLTRGSSGKARAGIPFKRPFANGEIIRPFLCLTKKEIEDYCQSYKLQPRIDPSNAKEIYSRNRFRKNVLPFLKSENPHVHEHFQRFSEELESDEQYLTELTLDKMNKVMEKTNGKVTLNIAGFLEMPMPLQRRGIKLILNYLYEEQPSSLSAIHIESIFSMIQNPHPSGSLDFPNGLKVVRSYGNCTFHSNLIESEPYHFELISPGVIQLPGGGSITARYDSPGLSEDKTYDSFLINVGETGWPIIIRSRKAGDRMSLKGMAGTKKIKDIFIDEKVPKSDRDRWPVLTDRNGTILWLPGLKKSSHSIESAKTGELMHLSISNDFFRGHRNNDEKRH
ncbi:tRNA lysidine(34) synthetase TilS [Mesobacillus maritimus]|uniref:tRNA lysidine(34) synthetase TilS n=1 Tax=Mesobacillus maritimus TaxID=1643336 RepID=UPI00203E773B|nr:tRNA lysidine(34) synthetase TilS [Mesobacillus maritimus]MCM3588552.1 tRNA lysidine(34) synthetase TilS [Mesobacillus maritimus]